MASIFDFIGKCVSFLPAPIAKRFEKSSQRSQDAIKNILLTMVMKMVHVVTTFLIVPLTINYVNPTRYGIWITLSSAIGWIHFFNLGLTNGLRNKYAEAKAKGDMLLARQYLSTTYISIGSIVLTLLIILQIANLFVDWPAVLHVDAAYKEELSKIFALLVTFITLNMVFNTASTLLVADQKPGLSSMIGSIGNICSLIAIYVLTKVSTGSLINLATYYSGIPCLVLFVSNIIIYRTKTYRPVTPSVKYFRLSLVKDLLSLGLRFFAIYLCLILIFQLINVAISREAGPIEVTRYSIAHKYFSIINMVVVMIITPIWSAFTDAYTKKDVVWMKSICRNLERVWLISCMVGILLILISPLAYKFWIGSSVDIPLKLSVCVYILIMCKTLGAIYMYMINGIGTIRIQTIIYVLFAIICFPTFSYICRNWGINYAILVPASVYLTQAIFGRIQLRKLLDGTATGVWNK